VILEITKKEAARETAAKEPPRMAVTPAATMAAEARGGSAMPLLITVKDKNGKIKAA
jgi:hypothetical protein